MPILGVRELNEAAACSSFSHNDRCCSERASAIIIKDMRHAWHSALARELSALHRIERESRTFALRLAMVHEVEM